MNCESCPPSQHGPKLDDVDTDFYAKAGGMKFYTSPGGPYAIGAKHLDGRSLYRVDYKDV